MSWIREDNNWIYTSFSTGDFRYSKTEPRPADWSLYLTMWKLQNHLNFDWNNELKRNKEECYRLYGELRLLYYKEYGSRGYTS